MGAVNSLKEYMETLLERIKRHEALRLKPYPDSEGKLTIGYGHNLDSGITEVHADAWLNLDLMKAEDSFRNSMTWRHINKPRQEVCIEMIFQMGLHGFLEFKKMIQALEIGDWEKVSDEMLDSLWAKQTPKRALELSGIMRRGFA